MEKTLTNRGFGLIRFRDLYGAECNIQKSSLATDDAIWIGIENPDPRIMVSGAGWKSYNIPEDVLLTTRMHLNREQAQEIIDILQVFVDTGEI